MWMYWLFRIDSSGHLVVSLFVNDMGLRVVEETVQSEAGTVLVRMTDFYGLSREDWLSLVIKVSTSPTCGADGSTAVCSWRNTNMKSQWRSWST